MSLTSFIVSRNWASSWLRILLTLVGIAMGVGGTALAAHAAGVVLMTNDLRRLADVVRDNERLRSELEGRYSFDTLIGSSAAFRRVIEQVTEVCETKATVLL